MATKEWNGKTWNIRRANGELLRDKKTGKARFFRDEAWADHFVRNVTEQEAEARKASA